MRMVRLNKNMEGFLFIDKPRGPSSFTVVASVRRALGVKKAGHAGTLDPGASGLLVLAVGPYTRLLPCLPLEPKVYRFSIRFGSETDTLDSEGSVIKSGGRVPTEQEIANILPVFTGPLQQRPPEYSAIKVKGGERAYALARRGEQVEMKPRSVEIHSLRMLRFDETTGEAELEVACSGGTYVRSLSRDMAEKLGTFGYAGAIRRIGAGRFTVDQALSFDKIAEAEKSLLPAREVFAEHPRIVLTDAQMMRLSTGSGFLCEQLSGEEFPSTVFAYDTTDRLVAVLKQVEGIKYHPEKVFL
jgi:tRNA pseudouridine55 synthase